MTENFPGIYYRLGDAIVCEKFEREGSVVVPGGDEATNVEVALGILRGNYASQIIALYDEKLISTLHRLHIFQQAQETLERMQMGDIPHHEGWDAHIAKLHVLINENQHLMSVSQ